MRLEAYVVWLFMSLWVCASVHVYQTLTRYLEKYWTYFHQSFSIDAFWGQKVKSSRLRCVQHPGKSLWLCYAISWKLLDWISPNFQLWCILGQGWMLQFLESKGQRSRSQHEHDQWPSRQSHTELDVMRRVPIPSCSWSYWREYFHIQLWFVS